MKKVAKRVYIIRIVCFLAVFLLVYCIIQSVFTVDHPQSKIMFEEFYQESKMTHDAIYLGPSSVYAFWKPTYAFNEYGITAYGLSTGACPIAAYRYMMEECLKTQNPSLFIIGIECFVYDQKNLQINFFHQLTDFMKFSPTKNKMVESVCESKGIQGTDKLEYYFPMIRFHPRWSELKKWDFEVDESNFFKGASEISTMKLDQNQEIEFAFSSETREIISENKEYLIELLSFCDEKELNVLFVAAPTLGNLPAHEMINYMGEVIESRGYDFINFNNMTDFEAMGLDPLEDYRHIEHTNIWGGIKFTKYMGKILKEEYHLPDRREDPEYESWNQAYRNFLTAVDARSHRAAGMMGSPYK